MASVRIPITTFERGDLLPSVCAVTGARSERRLRVVVRRVPRWVWVLILIPIVFIPAYVFLMERSVGRLPVTASVHQAVTRLSVLRTGLFSVAGVLVVAAAVLEAVPGAIALVALVVIAAALVVSGRRQRYSVRAQFEGPGDYVILEGVAPPFADAVTQLQPFMR